MSELVQKINDVSLDLARQIKKAQDAAEVKNKETFDNLAKASADTLEQVNQLKAAKEAQDKVIKDLEAVASRPGVGGEKIATKTGFDKAMATFLRKGNLVSQDDLNQGMNDFAKFACPSATDVELEKFKKGLVEGIDPQGGYWVTPQRSTQTVDRIFETSPVRQVANVMTTTSDVMDFIIDDNEATPGTWSGETETNSVSATPDIGLLSIPVHEIREKVLASQRILDDAGFDVQSWLVNKITTRFTRQENTSFISGDGSKLAKGILDYGKWTGAAVVEPNDGNYERNALEYVVSGSAGKVTYDGLVTVQNALLENYQPNAVFMMHRTAFGDILKLKDTQDRPLYQLANLMATGANQVLLGKRVIFASDVPQVGADTASVIYGDFKTGYTVLDRIGIRVLRDPYTAKPNIEFYVTKRVGGALTSYQSLKVLQLSE